MLENTYGRLPTQIQDIIGSPFDETTMKEALRSGEIPHFFTNKQTPAPNVPETRSRDQVTEEETGQEASLLVPDVEDEINLEPNQVDAPAQKKVRFK